MNVLRRLVSVLVVLTAAALLPAALTAAWVGAVVTDTDGYVEAVAPLAEEPEVRAAVSTRVEAALVRAVDVPGRAEQLRREIGRAGLAAYVQEKGAGGTALQAYVQAAVHRAVTEVVDSPRFPDLWRASNRTAHAALMDLLEDEPGARSTAVRVDLGPVRDAAASLLRDEGLLAAGSSADSTVAAFSVVGSEDLDTARTLYQRVEGWGPALATACAALLVLALVVSPLRRRTLVLAGVLSLLSVGVLALLLVAARSLLETAVDPGEARTVALVVWDALLSGLWTAVVVTLVISAVLAVALSLAPRLRRTGT